MLKAYRTLAETGRILGVTAERVLEFIEHGPLIGREMPEGLMVHAEDLAAFRRPLSAIQGMGAGSDKYPGQSALCQLGDGASPGDQSIAVPLQLATDRVRGVARATSETKAFRALLNLDGVRLAGQRFLRKTERQANGCLLWLGSKTSGGYGQIRVNGAIVTVSRFAWVLANGPLPERHDVDHTCSQRSCVEATHLEAISHAENIRRRDAGGRDNCVNARAALSAKRLHLVQDLPGGAK